MKIKFKTGIKHLTGISEEIINIPSTMSIEQLLEQYIFNKHDKVKDCLYTEGKIQKHKFAVVKNEQVSSLVDTVTNDDVITLLTPITGG